MKTHDLPRLIWAAKSSCGANFFHPSLFARYTSFAASQPRKNGRCLAKNSQNTQFATFNLGCKKFARCELPSSQPFPTLHVFYGVPTTPKSRCLAKNSQNKQLATLTLGCKKFARCELPSSQPFPTLHVFYGVPTTPKSRCLAKNSENTQLATFNLGCKKFVRREFFSSQHFCTLHVFCGVPATQKWPLPGQKQSEHTICHV